MTMHSRDHLIALTLVIVLSLVNFIGFWTFAGGFLSTRIELPQRSSRDDFPHTNHTDCIDDVSGDGCDGAHFDRVVILIVDALRVDFVFPSHGTGEQRMHEGQMPRTAAMLEEAVRTPPCMP
jgi:hypothetical protein